MMGFINRDGEDFREVSNTFSPGESLIEESQPTVFVRSQYSLQNVRQHRSQDRNPIHRALTLKTVAQIMSQPVITISIDTRLDAAWKIFKNNRISYMPVVGADKRYQGMISARGVLYKKMEEPETVTDSLPVSRFMVNNCLVETPDTNVKQIAFTLINKRVGAIPILDENRAPVGIVTSSDVLKAFFHSKSSLDFTA